MEEVKNTETLANTKETKKLDYNIVEEIESHQEKEEQEEKTES